MDYTSLGSSGLKVSRISLGCMSLPANESASIPIIHKAIDLGVNLFDTADIYQNGHNEENVGKALSGRRDKVLIASKVGNVPRKDGSGLDWNPSKKHILASIEESLRRLGTDYIDLYQLHGGTIQDNIDETIQAFETLKQQGKIRYYGISSIRPNVIKAYITKSAITSVMMQYSLLDRRPEEECLDMLQKNNIGALARGSIAQGLLAGKPPKQYLELTEEEVKKAAAAINSLSVNGRSPSYTAIRYVMQHPAVSSCIVGISRLDQLEDIVRTLETKPLEAEEMQFLKEAVRPILYKDHRQ